jgi:lambda repressor-like predicted transcriptional regulator
MVSRAGSAGAVAAAVAVPAGDTPAAGPATGARAAARPGLRPVVGVLSDGTAFYAPIGEVIVDGSRVTCHLCGRSLRSVAAHLTAHGWTKDQYCAAFGLERSQSLEGPETRKLRAAALSARLVFDPAIRAGSAAGRDRARRGELTRDAAQAARGRPFPEQRRRKAAQAFARGPVAARAGQVSRERADRYLAEAGADAARRLGYSDLRALVLARSGAGASLAAISREAGLHKDWLSRYLERLDPATAAAVRRAGAGRPDVPWRPALARLGFGEVASYLRDRHAVRHWSVNAIAAEVGVSYHAVESALSRHGLDRVAHAAKRHAAAQRAARVAADLGFASVAEYVARRRAAGWTWGAMAEESGQPQSWLRRHATAAAAAAATATAGSAAAR